MGSEVTSTSYATSRFLFGGARSPIKPRAGAAGATIVRTSPLDLLQRLVGSLVRTAFAPMLLSVTLPYRAVLLVLLSVTNTLVRVLVLLRAPPRWYVRGERARDLAVALELMQQREDLYRKKLGELREELALRDKDRRRAMRRAKQLHNEVTALQGHLAEVAEVAEYRGGGGGMGAEPAGAEGDALSPLGLQQLERQAAEAEEQEERLLRHLERRAATAGGGGGGVSPVASLVASLVCCALALWGFFAGDPHGVHKKIVTAALFPTLYFSYGALQQQAPPPPTPLPGAAPAPAPLRAGGASAQQLLAQAMCWFLVGFVVCDRFTEVAEP